MTFLLKNNDFCSQKGKKKRGEILKGRRRISRGRPGEVSEEKVGDFSVSSQAARNRASRQRAQEGRRERKIKKFILRFSKIVLDYSMIISLNSFNYY